jgi:hypothetical protein
MRKTWELLAEVTKRIQPGKGQKHSLLLDGERLELCLMLGDNYLPIHMDQADFEKTIDELAKEILSLAENASEVKGIT